MWPQLRKRLMQPAGGAFFAAYLLAIALLCGRIAYLDGWDGYRYLVLGAFLVTVSPDRALHPSRRTLLLGASFFAGLSFAVTYLPDLWFSIAYSLHHGQHYLWRANGFMRSLPFNSASFLWSHQVQPLTQWARWVYENGFDMVVWIPVMRSLLACDARKTAHYALSAHIVQFPLIMPIFASIRVDEVWSVLGHPDLLARGWNDEVRLDLGANCFPSMHTSVAFAVMLLALREKSRVYRITMFAYGAAIILSTMYMQVHWVLDVLAGLALGWSAVKLVDALLEKRFAAAEPQALAGSEAA